MSKQVQGIDTEIKEDGGNSVEKNMVHVNDHFAGLPRMEALVRIANIPIVETGVKTAGLVYHNLKTRNGLFAWSFNTAEGVIFAAVDTVRPAVKIIEGPLHHMDQILCTGLDLVERRVPSVYLPPQMIYNNTKEYMSDHLVRPVLKRAGSMKQMGSAVLDSPLSAYAADRIEDAIDVADKYVERYLPSKEDHTDSAVSEDDNESKPIHTFHKGQRFSRKLKRRLTQRTLVEAHALQERIHILRFAADRYVKNPKLCFEDARNLWNYLSLDEPENQARPQTIDELCVMVARESARRAVHLANFTGNTIQNLPAFVNHLLHHFLDIANVLIRKTHLDPAIAADYIQKVGLIVQVSATYHILQAQASQSLENLAHILAGRSNTNGTHKQSQHNKINKRNPATHLNTNARAANNNPRTTAVNPNPANGIY